jgi:hypothetical protein
MKGDLRCIDGTLWRHDPQYDDPDHEVSRGTCPECRGKGCESEHDLLRQAFDDAEKKPQPPYPNCRTPELCDGKGYCPRDISCFN